MEGFDEGSAPHKERPGRVFERRSSTVKHAEAEERAELARAAAEHELLRRILQRDGR